MPDWRALSGLCAAGRLDARQVAIGFGISGPAQPLAVRHHGRPATRLPGGAGFRVGLLLLRRQRRREANDAVAIDAEVGGLAGRQRTPGGDGVRLGLRPPRPALSPRPRRQPRCRGPSQRMATKAVKPERAKPQRPAKPPTQRVLRGRRGFERCGPGRRQSLRRRRRDTGGNQQQDGWNDTHVTGPERSCMRDYC